MKDPSRSLRLLAALAAIVTPAQPAVAGVGELDPRFALHGQTPITGLYIADSVYEQADGSVVVFGEAELDPNGWGVPENYPTVMYRFSRDGSPDGRVGPGGRRTIPLPGESAGASGFRAQADGRFVFCGSASESTSSGTTYVNFVGRVLPDGTPDPTFGTAGLTRFGPAYRLDLTSTALLPGGDVVIAASDRADQRVHLYRFDASGRRVAFPGGSSQDVVLPEYRVEQMIAMADGSLVLRLGQGMDASGAIRRVAPDGTLDETFTARVHAVYPDTTRRPTVVAEPGTGRLLLVDAVDAGLRVRRFQADGRPDPSFGDIDGVAIIDNKVSTGDPDVDGPIVTGGLTWSAGSAGRWLLFGSAPTRRGVGNTHVLLRLRADFSREGWTRLPLGFPESPGLPESVRLAPTRDGDLLLLETNGMSVDPANTAQATYVVVARAQLSTGSGPGALGFAGNGWRTAVSEREGPRTIRVMRSGGRSGAVSVRYRTASGTADADDYVAAQGTLSWPDGDDTPRAIAFTVRDDTLLEGEETVRLQLYDPVGAAVASGELTVYIEDDEAIRALRFERSEYRLVEGFASLIDVRPANPLPQAVTARFVVSGPDGLVAGANAVRLRWEAGSVERRSGYLVGNGNPVQVDGERRGTLLLADALGPITVADGGQATAIVVVDATPTPTPSSPAPAGTGGTGTGGTGSGSAMTGGGGALDVATLAVLAGMLFAALRRERAGRRRGS